MKRRIHYRSVAVLALCLSTSFPPTISAEESDGPAEQAGETIDETADKLRDGAKKGLKKAGEALEETGEAISEEAKEAAETVDGDGE